MLESPCLLETVTTKQPQTQMRAFGLNRPTEDSRFCWFCWVRVTFFQNYAWFWEKIGKSFWKMPNHRRASKQGQFLPREFVFRLTLCWLSCNYRNRHNLWPQFYAFSGWSFVVSFQIIFQMLLPQRSSWVPFANFSQVYIYPTVTLFAPRKMNHP